MVKVSQEWHNARLEVLDEFWNNKFDFEKFKERIKEVDKIFKDRRSEQLKLEDDFIEEDSY